MRTYVSVDCVVFGFDNEQLNVLLVERKTFINKEKSLKLPGSLIYYEEDTDKAAHRVLNELTGIKKMTLKQFKSFTSPERASDPADIAWLEAEYSSRIDRLITVAYLSICRINHKLNVAAKYKTVEWRPVSRLPQMPFDHNKIVEESLNEIRKWAEYDPAVIFELLPSKFTAAELRRLFEAVYRTRYDVRNFHKKIMSMEYVVPLEEKQHGVSHRAARYYRFDKKLYKKLRGI
ncbi:MAG: NUDIX domain-containing protein [Dysgonamonadaceae bacterium]|nr:NUDIX domain-containing protein [Dysgonamonadaceae bacterium]